MVDLFRALPPLVVIVLIYFGLPSVGFAPTAYGTTWASLSLVLMAFAEEIFWAGITAVPKGQWEASRSTGLSFLQTLSSVVLPQAIRLTIPPADQPHHRHHQGHRTRLGGRAVGNPVAGASGVSFSFNPSPLTLGAAAYLILFLPVVIAGRWIETRFAWKR